MAYLNFHSLYEKFPETRVDGYDDEVFCGNAAVMSALQRAMQNRHVLVVDCYPGVDDEALLPELQRAIRPALTIDMRDVFPDGDELTRRMQSHLTEDRVRGVMYYGTVLDFLDEPALQAAREAVTACEGTALVYGFGAALVTRGDVLVYADLARWEIQLRYRKGMPNYKQHNEDEDILRKYKRGFFVEWRIADRHKRDLYDEIDFYLDANDAAEPKLVSGAGFRAGLRAVSRQPFRLVPYFDPGVWGGQWMKEVCGLDRDTPNFAWSFDGVPEENSLLLRYGDVRVETPAMNLIQYLPRLVLGERTFARFGAEYPIRFDFLDTMGGQNLSLQVHPDTEYIRSHFGMTYTQDESYYILDAGEGGGVYLGLKEGVNPQAMIADLERAQTGECPFDAERYVNFFPAKKHDHFLIPAGTVHCSSSNCMVLEVSATPYIFTFKLWDWDRLGLDGRPRPIHIEDGKHVIRFDRTTPWVRENLVDHFETLADRPEYTEVRTGLHPLEFVETRVYTVRDHVDFPADGEFSMLNLVDGQRAVVESPSGAFEPYEVHYAETFILPAAAGAFRIRPVAPDQPCKVLRANVRHP